MLCSDVFDLIQRLDKENGAEIELSNEETRLLEELLHGRYMVESHPNKPSNKELEYAKNKLAKLVKDEDKIRKLLVRLGAPKFFEKNNRKQLLEQLQTIESQERTVRSGIITMSERAAEANTSVSINGRYYRVTYEGRNLVSTISDRSGRLSGIEVADLEKEVNDLRKFFDERAKRAETILKIISPKMSEVDEIHCRSSAVGLSGLEGTPDQITARYLSIYRSLEMYVHSPENRSTAAESLLMIHKDAAAPDASRYAASLGKMMKAVYPHTSNESETLDCVTLLMSIPNYESVYTNILSGALAFSKECSRPCTLAPSIIAASSRLKEEPDAIQQYTELYDELNRTAGAGRETQLVAALLAESTADISALMERFAKIRERLVHFSAGSMTLPAAMLVLIPVDIDELFDVLRMTSASVAKYKIALGGMENLSLGAKIMTQSSILSSLPTASAGGADWMGSPDGLSVRSPSNPMAAGMFMYFHRSSWHRMAMTDQKFHPVHTHYIYG